MKLSLRSVFLLFLIGGVIYGAIEVLWRGKTHPAMLLAGGISTLILAIICIKLREEKFFYKVVLGSLCITAVELIFGLIFNIGLKMNIWDYSNLKFNFLGQICILFTVIWGFICVAAIPVVERLIFALQKQR